MVARKSETFEMTFKFIQKCVLPLNPNYNYKHSHPIHYVHSNCVLVHTENVSQMFMIYSTLDGSICNLLS